MDFQDMLAGLRQKAKEDSALREALLATQAMASPADAFCAIAAEQGYPISILELAFAGESDYAHMRRATNGGGENSPVLLGEDDYYDLFMSELVALRYKAQAQ